MKFLVQSLTKVLLIKPSHPERAQAYTLSKDSLFIEQERTSPERGFPGYIVFIRPGLLDKSGFYKLLVPKDKVLERKE